MIVNVGRRQRKNKKTPSPNRRKEEPRRRNSRKRFQAAFDQTQTPRRFRLFYVIGLRWSERDDDDDDDVAQR